MRRCKLSVLNVEIAMQLTKAGYKRYTIEIAFTRYILDGSDKNIGWKVLSENLDGTFSWIDTRATKAEGITAIKYWSTDK